MNKISVIIRTYNEEKHLEDVLKGVKKQLYRNYEIILVDSESTDSTLKIAEKYGAKIIKIRKKDFNYSYASNIGAEQANGDILCYISGHSVPLKEDYFSNAIELFKDKKIGGVYGDVVALKDGSYVEKIFNFLGYLKNRSKKVVLESHIHPGILSCSNAFIRRKLWETHPFRIELGRGGEDVGMAYEIIQDGYYIAKAPELLVAHSHGSGLVKFMKEYRAWGKMFRDVKEYYKIED